MSNQLILREATPSDLSYLVWADLQDEGYTHSDTAELTESERLKHTEKIRFFVTQRGKGAWVLEDPRAACLAGMILFRFRNRVEVPEQADSWLFMELPDDIFPVDGRFCEVFNLRVEPKYRRQGCAIRLKNQMERSARERGVRLLYTHTEATNEHVLKLNRKLGYVEARRGPIWDEIIRVSLVKRLE
jgi:ribosomal protein S18 acetylase RimI-like enzyme